jgi:hypothetical protein
LDNLLTLSQPQQKSGGNLAYRLGIVKQGCSPMASTCKNRSIQEDFIAGPGIGGGFVEMVNVTNAMD